MAVAACGSQEDVPVPQAERPSAMRIESLDVETAIISIDVTDDGVLEPPEDAALAGWWRHGAGLGAGGGSAVIVGHSASLGGGVFDDVADLQPGALIEVDGETRTFTYRVGSIEIVSKDDFAAEAERIFSLDAEPRLALISCIDWENGSWQSNVIVTAAPVLTA